MILRAGDTVRIYHKPIIGEQLEGRAILKECVKQDDGDGLSIWIVQFTEDRPGWIYHGWTYQRTVNEANATALF